MNKKIKTLSIGAMLTMSIGLISACSEGDMVEEEMDKSSVSRTIVSPDDEERDDKNRETESAQTQGDDVDDDGNRVPKSVIPKDEAIDIAITDAAPGSSDISIEEVELDEDDGRHVWGIEMRKGNLEFDYEIDAKSGDIIKSDSEVDDD